TFERDVTVDPASLTVEMRIYPNPTTPNEEVKIELSNLSSTGVLTIANINGLVLEKYQLKDISKNHDLVLKVNNYAPGIYFVTYRSKEGLVTKKLVIQSR
ncbi:MAG TPA: T9SS type A sorting domain-containing protein, partial [Bacteroidales bacterium]|nr:T9SS type A sorting domain-containing protein [Bacteroidales bacterium]